MKAIVVSILLACLSVAPARAQEDIFSDAKDFVFFADFVIGSDWSFQLAVSNNSPTDSLDGFMGIAVDVNHEAAVTWKEALESGTTQRFSIPPGGTRIYNEWPNVGPGEMIRGGVIILQLSDFPDFQSDTQMLSAVLTYGNDQTGIELAVPPLRVEDLTPPFFNEGY